MGKSDPRTVDVATLLAAESRGEVRRLGEWLDGEGRGQRAALVAAAVARGVVLPEEWEELPGKKLLRLCLARADEAQVRTNPIALDEAFTCAVCGAEVPAGGRRPRDHCPFCLRSLHVDVVPGDRAAGCGGVLEPIAVVRTGSGADLEYRCARCGAARRNRVLDDVVPPDDPAALRVVAAGRSPAVPVTR